MALTTVQKHKLKKFVKELESYRGRHTELVSVYIPQGYDINKIINHLSQEQGTATNIKSASTRKNVIDALEKMIQHLKLFKKTPENGLAAFAGNVAAREGQQDFKVWSVEPPVPLKTRIYRCDKEFVLDILRDLMEVKELYALVVIDRRDANIAYLKGKTIVPVLKTHSQVPGKFKAGGQCLVKGSLVQLSNGSLPKIEIVHNPHIVKSVMIKNNFSIKESNITGKWNVKKDKVYKIITKNPRIEVESSKDHVFFVASNDSIKEKSAEELREGDHLIMPEKVSIKGNIQKLNSKKYYNSFIINKKGQELLKKKREEKNLLQRELAKQTNMTQTTVSYYEIGRNNPNKDYLERLCKKQQINYREFLKKYAKSSPHQGSDVRLSDTLNEELAQFLGYFMGDGCIETDRITFFEQDRQVALSYKNKYDKFFHINSSYKFRESKNHHQIRFTSRPLVRLIKEEFPEIKKALDSEVPNKILESSDNVVASFLRGFFDAEGYTTYSRKQVALGINNKRIIQQLQLIFLRFGIISSLHEYDNRRNMYSNNPRFTLDITEKKSLELFKRYVGFTSNIKSKKLSTIIKTKSDTSYVRQLIVPGREIREIIEKAGYNLQLFPKVTNFFRNERMMSKQTFKSSILDYVKDKKLYKQLEEIYNYPILPVKIKEIKITNKPTEMIDISVKNQNFIANGIIVHNSAARFSRIREGAIKDHFKKVAEHIKNEFLGNKNLKGIIVGGPGPSKYDFVNSDIITTELKRKIIAIKDLSYTGEFGLQELLDKSGDVLAKEEVMDEKNIMTKFFETLSKKPGMVSYGKKEVMEQLKNGTVETLLLSEELDETEIEQFEEEAKAVGTEVKIISTETREGAQLRDMSMVGAILRYDVS
ncbi:MAG: LAGLIDADG family homing endonuclease [Candidatus Woesearchaeota archaeon]|jgi:peptide subunit release factor 1 (eRF1)/transcriptional regulator with XRE-family HTH domain|nr:LAGLIDADG family homing endonuclease [Candidatus Woesearchaeota archaeon]|tara:strand:+ start:1163 stop:3790 length:2628 start_codon:yes stop_codon:yes gene_type:complete